MEQRVLTVEEARAIDRDAVERLGMPSILLMENAARGVAEQARRMGSRFLALCGPGSNGGDGLAAVRHLLPAARAILLTEPDPERAPDAALQGRILRAAGVPLPAALPASGELAQLQADAGLVWIDALFGTGLGRPLEGLAARFVEAFNGAAGPRLSVDLPSGIDGDSGVAAGPACRAQATVTFEAPKRGLLAPAGRPYAGEIVVVSLGLPRVHP